MWSTPVVHCAHSYALAVEGPVLAASTAADGDGEEQGAAAAAAAAGAGAEAAPWKVVYSGDTRPCDALVEVRSLTEIPETETRCALFPEDSPARALLHAPYRVHVACCEE